MGWFWYLLMLGFWPFAVLILMIIGLLLYFTGTIGMDGLFAAAEKQGTLTCWHCGKETPAGPRHCTHCHGELQ